MIALRVSGLGSLERGMRKLVQAASPEHLEDAARVASEPIVSAAKGRAPSDVIAEGIQVVNVLTKPTGEVVSEIGLPGGRKPWFHGLFIELGTGPRIQKKTGRRTGSMPADPFLRPAFDAEKGNARRLFFNHLRKLVLGAARG